MTTTTTTTRETILSCIIIIGFVLTMVRGGSVVNNTLRCYQCAIQGKVESACDESDLKLCPSNQAYDRCITNFRRNDTGYYIIKKCALAPCTFRTREVDSLFSTDCQLDWSTSDCAKCCQGDGCNRRNSGDKLLTYCHISSLVPIGVACMSTLLVKIKSGI